MSKTSGRYCTRVGAGAFTFVLRKLSPDWRKTRANQWSPVDLIKTHCGRKVGTKVIDGEKLDVIQVGHSFYAERNARRA